MRKSLAVLGWVLLACFTTVNLFTATALYRATTTSTWPRASTREYTYEGDDYPKQLPFAVSQAAMVVNNTHRYGLTADDDWSTIFPKGNGWVRLGPEGRSFAVAMYHQLHCLDALRIAMAQVHAAAHGGPALHSDNPNHSTGEGTFAHADHCFNYLRQALLCSADLTLEASKVKMRPDGVLDDGASGVGMIHQCKDWTQIRLILEENHEQYKDVPKPGYPSEA